VCARARVCMCVYVCVCVRRRKSIYKQLVYINYLNNISLSYFKSDIIEKLNFQKKEEIVFQLDRKLLTNQIVCNKKEGHILNTSNFCHFCFILFELRFFLIIFSVMFQ